MLAMTAALKLASVMGLSLVFCSTSKNGPPMPPMPSGDQSTSEFIDALAKEWLGEDPDAAKLLATSDRFFALKDRYKSIEDELARGLDDKPDDEVEQYAVILGLRVDANVKAKSLVRMARRELLTDEESRNELRREVRGESPGYTRQELERRLDERLKALRKKM